MKVAGYIRVSTEKQVKEGESLEAQRDSILEYTNRKKYDLIEIYEDAGKTGGSMTSRVDLKRCLNDANQINLKY